MKKEEAIAIIKNIIEKSGMDEEDLKEYINIILEMKQNIELQAEHLEG